MTAHSAIFKSTCEQLEENRLPLYDAMCQIETLALDKECDSDLKARMLAYAAQALTNDPGAEPFTLDELRQAIDDHFDTI